MYQTAAALPEAQVGNGAAACHRQILDRHLNPALASTSELEEHNTPAVKVTRAEQPPVPPQKPLRVGFPCARSAATYGDPCR
jgi:hypothetical protein